MKVLHTEGSNFNNCLLSVEVSLVFDPRISGMTLLTK